MEYGKSISLLHWVIRILAIIAIVIGSYWLIAWLSGWANEVSVQWMALNKIMVKTNMAFCLVSAGTVLLLTSFQNIKLKWLTAVLSSLVFLTGALTLYEHFFTTDLGIDQLLATEPAGAIATTSPNRMGFPGSLSLTLIGAGFLIKIWYRRLLASFFGVLVCLINLVPAVGYFLDIDLFYSRHELTMIAWPSVIALLSLGLGLVFSNDHGLVKMLLKDSPGGLLLRRLLPAILLIPLVIAFFIIRGYRLNYYYPDTGIGLLVIAMVFSLFIMAFFIARSLDSYDEISKQHERELQQSKDHLSIALEAAELGTWSFDIDTGNAIHSLRHDQIFGYDELQPNWSFEIMIQHILPEYHRAVREAVARGIKSGTLSFETKIAWPDGSIHWIAPHGRVLVNDEGKPVRMTGVVADITDRKKVEEALSESEKKYKELVTKAKTIIIKMDSAGLITFINEYGLNFFGYKDEEMTGKTAMETIVPQTESTGRDLTEIIDNIYKDPDKYSVNINENIKKNGERVWVEWYNKALLDENGKKTGHMSIGIDITKRKKSEDALKAAREKLNLALENGNIGLWEWDLITNEVSWDERMEKMFGLQRGSFGKTYNAFEALVNEEDISHVRNAIKYALDNELPYATIFRTRSENSKVKYISAKGSARKDKQGRPVAITGVCSDVTQLKEGTETLINKLNEELLRSNKELERFAYVASHDLQEPLRMVSSFTQLLSKQYKEKLDERAQEYIDFAVDGSKRMYDLLNGLLDYSRINTRGKTFKNVNINKVLETVVQNLSLVIKERGAEIKAGELPVVFADENQMIQLFQNLIANGIKFSPKAPEILISSTRENENFVFSISDKGIGIEPQYFEKIFQIFQRLLPKEQYDGTGIGLAICKRITELHGGKIWVESKYRKGSTFHFTIPAKI